MRTDLVMLYLSSLAVLAFVGTPLIVVVLALGLFTADVAGVVRGIFAIVVRYSALFAGGTIGLLLYVGYVLYRLFK